MALRSFAHASVGRARGIHTSAFVASSKNPVYMKSKPWNPVQELDQDGVPLAAPDDRPHDLTNRPKVPEPLTC